MGKTISSWLVIYQLDLDSWTFVRPIWPLHIDWGINKSHNLVTDINTQLWQSKIGTRIVIQSDMLWKMILYVSIPPATRELSPFLSSYLISIWLLARLGIWRGERLQIQQASHSESVLNWVPRQVGETLCIWVTVCTCNLAWYDSFLVENSVAAVAIFQGRCHESPNADQML